MRGGSERVSLREMFKDVRERERERERGGIIIINRLVKIIINFFFFFFFCSHEQYTSIFRCVL